MISVVIVLICVFAVLLVLVVLVQNSKGGGLTGEFGGLGSNQLMGVKKTTDLLEQITWGLGIGMMVLTLTAYIMVDKNAGVQIESANADRAATRQVPAAAPAPARQAAPAGQPKPGEPAPGNSLSALRP
jgi:preprotein translocase subunit SecG